MNFVEEATGFILVFFIKLIVTIYQVNLFN